MAIHSIQDVVVALGAAEARMDGFEKKLAQLGVRYTNLKKKFEDQEMRLQIGGAVRPPMPKVPFPRHILEPLGYSPPGERGKLDRRKKKRPKRKKSFEEVLEEGRL